ncbi:hypothetical protein ACFPN1_13745 [Lysobacter yangpyeongensis]|uniref:Uncharacterized protein n=1 Tax=Lysobacter yangpyeongensis TaxID=346182 RepID=A0ABW0SQH1_9GAMM
MSGEWLPDLLLLEDSQGNWNAYLERLHACFKADFVDSKPTWPGKRVGLKHHPAYDGKSATFWHLISEGDEESERMPDMRRCERIGWPRPMIDEFDEAAPGTTSCRVVWWVEEREREQRYLLALDDFSYVVVVADRGSYVLPWTAFCCEYAHQRDKRRKAFERYWEARKG